MPKENNIIKDEILLTFKKNNKKEEINISLDTATRNILILGGTGSGKTSTICYPALFNLARYNCPGLILDIKGGYTNFAQLLNRRIPEKCIILGVQEHCTPINLIAGITPYKLKEFLQEAISEDHSNKYWGSNGIEDMVLLFELLKSLDDKKSPTLADLYYLFNNQFFLKNLNDKAPFEIQEKIRNRTQQDGFSIFHAIFTVGRSNEMKEQQTWQLSSILKFLKPFYENEYLYHYFCNAEALDFRKIIYEEEKIIVLNLPNSIFGDTSAFVSQILRANFRDTVKSRGEDWLQSQGYGENKFTFLLIDEYQQFINSKSSSSMDDNNWFDTSRGYGHINIICTQSIDSLISKTNEAYTNQLIGNCRNIIHLGTHAKHSLEHLELIGSKEVAEKLKNQQEEGLGYIYIGQNQLRKTETSLIVTCQSSMKTMNYFVLKTVKEELRGFKHFQKELINKIRFNYLENCFFNSKTNEWDYLKEEEEKIIIDKKLYVITSKSESSGFKDFNYIINKKGLKFSEIHVLSVIEGDLLNMQFYEENNFEKDSIIVFVRGGGNFKNCFLDQEEHLEKFKELRGNGIKIGIGYGHISDEYQLIDVDYTGITPTDLAYNIAESIK